MREITLAVDRYSRIAIIWIELTCEFSGPTRVENRMARARTPGECAGRGVTIEEFSDPGCSELAAARGHATLL
jgi:hypothetical protein